MRPALSAGLSGRLPCLLQRLCKQRRAGQGARHQLRAGNLAPDQSFPYPPLHACAPAGFRVGTLKVGAAQHPADHFEIHHGRQQAQRVEGHFSRSHMSQRRRLGGVQRSVLREPARLPGRLHAVQQRPARAGCTFGEIDQHQTGVAFNGPACRGLQFLVPVFVLDLTDVCRPRCTRALLHGDTGGAYGLQQLGLRWRDRIVETEQIQRPARGDRAALQILSQEWREPRGLQPAARSAQFLEARDPAGEAALVFPVYLAAQALEVQPVFERQVPASSGQFRVLFQVEAGHRVLPDRLLPEHQRSVGRQQCVFAGLSAAQQRVLPQPAHPFLPRHHGRSTPHGCVRGAAPPAVAKTYPPRQP